MTIAADVKSNWRLRFSADRSTINYVIIKKTPKHDHIWSPVGIQNKHTAFSTPEICVHIGMWHMWLPFFLERYSAVTNSSSSSSSGSSSSSSSSSNRSSGTRSRRRRALLLRSIQSRHEWWQQRFVVCALACIKKTSIFEVYVPVSSLDGRPSEAVTVVSWHLEAKGAESREQMLRTSIYVNNGTSYRFVWT